MIIVYLSAFCLGYLFHKYYQKTKLTIIMYRKRKKYFDAMCETLKDREWTQQWYKDNPIIIKDESDIDAKIFNLHWLQKHPEEASYHKMPYLHELKRDAKLCSPRCSEERPC